MLELTPYESDQVERIAAWKGRRPNPAQRGFDRLTAPARAACRHLIPAATLHELLRRAYQTSTWRVGADVIRREAGMSNLAALRKGSLEKCDRLARSVKAVSGGVVTVESLLSGVGGIATDLIDIPAELLLALRSVHRIAACYGYALDRPEHRTYALAIMQLALADTPEERLDVEVRLRQLERTDACANGEDGACQAIEDDVVEDIGSALIEDKMSEIVPILGSAVSLILDSNFIRAVERAAQCVCQERWLRENGKVDVIEPIDERFRPGLALERRLADVIYATGFWVGFGTTFVSKWLSVFGTKALPEPVVAGLSDGDEAASRDAAELAARIREGWSGAADDARVAGVVSVSAS
jgi:hypothetical protein